MNRLTFTLVAVVCAMAVTAKDNDSDTVRVINNPQKIVITQGDSRTVITVEGSQDDPSMLYQLKLENSADGDKWNIETPFNLKARPRRHASSRVQCFRNTYIGGVIPLNSPEWMVNSFEIGIAQIIGGVWQPLRNGTEFSLGIGMGYRSICIGNGMTFRRYDDALQVVKVADNTTDNSARIHTFNINVPLMITQRLIGSFGVSVGAIVNFNTYTTAKTSSTNADGIKTTTSYKGLQQKIASVDLMGILGFVNNIGVYVRYSPTPVFKKGYGPRNENLSIGASIGF